jgi:hypothetical protein
MVAAKRKDFSGTSRRLERAIDTPAPTTAAEHLRTIEQQVEAIGRGDLEAAVKDAHELVTVIAAHDTDPD